MASIYVLPVGKPEKKVLEKVAEGVENRFHVPVAILPAVRVPSDALNVTRLQYHSTLILRELAACVPMDALRLLGVTNVDLYIPRLNFVFGEAMIEGRVGIISLYRLYPEFYGEAPNEQLVVERATKEAVHELGHTFGLRHCANRECVMFFSNSIGDTDRKSSDFCNECRKQVDSKILVAA